MLYIAGRGAYSDWGRDRWDGVVNMNGIMYAFTAYEFHKLALTASLAVQLKPTWRDSDNSKMVT